VAPPTDPFPELPRGRAAYSQNPGLPATPHPVEPEDGRVRADGGQPDRRPAGGAAGFPSVSSFLIAIDLLRCFDPEPVH
jgi:hypothetical protein